MPKLKPCGCGGTRNSRIIRLTNVITEADFDYGDEDYEDWLIDMRNDGKRYGELLKVVIPRPKPDHHLTPTPGVGKIFFEYADSDAASRARSAFHERPFELKIVVAEYYPENMYAQGRMPEFAG
ncbi:hypothetical protein EUTSA_v10011869mg [Eutrema salsugineum]|uniref:RRM domain-containing protein n=1 Tax=Eutrema salsugineum TaxID=72664 RepID=V4MF62_EUTSA|nr:splicing factor U2af large subunit B [Eutrema salsugineum]ESQ29916.1 hypothetical protein EUTSA_v10011869mg [Eutrema salsugineum]